MAVQTDGGASYFWFLYLLKQNHIDKNEIKFESMTAGTPGQPLWPKGGCGGDLGTLVVQGGKDGLWPRAHQERQDSRGDHRHLGIPQRFCRCPSGCGEKVVRAWFDALDYIHKNPDDAYAIMAKNLGQSLDDFKSSVHEVRWYDQALNKQYFGNPVTDGQLYKLTEMAADFWVEQGIIKQKPNISELVDGRFVE